MNSIHNSFQQMKTNFSCLALNTNSRLVHFA